MAAKWSFKTLKPPSGKWRFGSLYLRGDVLPSDIANATPCIAGKCPITLMMKREFPDCEVFVGYTKIRVLKPDGREETYKIPRSLEHWMLAFDRREKVSPITLHLMRAN